MSQTAKIQFHSLPEIEEGANPKMASPVAPERVTSEDFGGDSISVLRTEWKLFWSAIFGQPLEDLEQKGSNPRRGRKRLDFVELLPEEKLKQLNIDEIKVLTKKLSHERKTLNLKLESIKKDLDQSQQTVENLMLVGSDVGEIQNHIEILRDQGEKTQQTLNELAEKLRSARQLEDFLKRKSKGS